MNRCIDIWIMYACSLLNVCRCDKIIYMVWCIWWDTLQKEACEIYKSVFMFENEIEFYQIRENGDFKHYRYLIF